ncbi:unnamed protein product [Urochloa decumbens]|uniref:Remorin C-terminal domain-containing protein n=1 Tax=Urochloa decumbens TaxID=240449 RepID=A0ABC8V7L9_9POAL
MPRPEPALGFPAAAAAGTGHDRPPERRRKKQQPPPPRRRRPAQQQPVGPRGAGDPDPPPASALPPVSSSGSSFATRGTAAPDEEEGRNGVSAAGSEEEAEATSDSFSYSLRECQKQRRRLKSEGSGLVRTPASHELNGGGGIELLVLSPRQHAVLQGLEFRACAAGTGSNRRYGGSGMVLPFNNGRKLPSKWEDAEKWILSPVSCDGIGRMSAPAPHHRRPKSKSGPLGHPAGIPGAYAAVSPLVPCFDGVLAAANFAAHSPFSAGVLIPEHGRIGDYSSGRGRSGDDGSSRSYSAEKEPYILRSASIHAWTETLMEASAFANTISEETTRDDKLQGQQEATSVISSPIIKKDVATQMSPEDSISSSPKARHSCSSLPSGHLLKEANSHIPKPEIRDVQVDDQVTVTRWSKRHVTRGSDKRSTNVIEWRKKTIEAQAPSFDEKERERCMSKCKREEAKITAWENLQKAKAEAAIRKLEMKLEKKRSSSMDKILGKLRSAQKKAEDMRSVVSSSEDQCGVKAKRKASSFVKTGKPFSCCFTYRAC